MGKKIWQLVSIITKFYFQVFFLLLLFICFCAHKQVFDLSPNSHYLLLHVVYIPSNQK